jgi:hypothetical protein
MRRDREPRAKERRGPEWVLSFGAGIPMVIGGWLLIGSGGAGGWGLALFFGGLALVVVGVLLGPFEGI